MIAHELVSLERGRDAIPGRIARDIRWLGTKYLAHASQADRLRAVVDQSDDILDRPAEIRFTFGGEQNAAGADVLGVSVRDESSGPRADDRKRQLELEAPRSSLFHELYWFMLFR
jgi:hypothetical protein